MMNDDTLALISAAQSGDDEAFDKLVSDNAALVKCVVKKYLGRGVEYDDLYQLGCMGLVKCIKKFDASFNVQFSTYAVPMIAGEIKRFLRDDGMIKVSRSLKELARSVELARRSFSEKYGFEPSLNELANHLHADIDDIIMALEASKPCVSIYEPVYADDPDTCLIDKLEDDDSPMKSSIDRIMLKELLASLPPEERKLIMLRYFQDMTQSQVAKMLNVSQVQISRMEKRIMKKLKNTY